MNVVMRLLTLSLFLSVVGVGNGTKMLGTMLTGSKVSLFTLILKSRKEI